MHDRAKFENELIAKIGELSRSYWLVYRLQSGERVLISITHDYLSAAAIADEYERVNGGICFAWPLEDVYEMYEEERQKGTI